MRLMRALQQVWAGGPHAQLRRYPTIGAGGRRCGGRIGSLDGRGWCARGAAFRALDRATRGPRAVQRADRDPLLGLN